MPISQFLVFDPSEQIYVLCYFSLLFIAQPFPSSCILRLPTLPANSKQMPHVLPHRETQSSKSQIPALYLETHLHPQQLPHLPLSQEVYLLIAGILSTHALLPRDQDPHLLSLPESSAAHCPAFPLSHHLLFTSKSLQRNSKLPSPLPHFLFFPQVTGIRLLPSSPWKLPQNSVLIRKVHPS